MPMSQSTAPTNILPSMAKMTLLMWLSLRTLRWGAYPGLSRGQPALFPLIFSADSFPRFDWFPPMHSCHFWDFSLPSSLFCGSVFWTLTILIYLDSQLHLLNTVCQAPHRFTLPDSQPGISHKSVNRGKHKAHLFVFWISRTRSEKS